jgi:hypothetical protein
MESEQGNWLIFDGTLASVRQLSCVEDTVKKVEYKDCESCFLIYPPKLEQVRFVDIQGEIDFTQLPTTVKKITIDRKGNVSHPSIN